MSLAPVKKMKRAENLSSESHRNEATKQITGPGPSWKDLWEGELTRLQRVMEAFFVSLAHTSLTIMAASWVDLSLSHSLYEVQDVWKYQTWEEIPQNPARCNGVATLVGRFSLISSWLRLIELSSIPSENECQQLAFLCTVGYEVSDMPSTLLLFHKRSSVICIHSLMIWNEHERDNRLWYQTFQRPWQNLSFSFEYRIIKNLECPIPFLVSV